MNKKQIVRHLKAAREKQGLTIYSAGMKAGLKSSQVTGIETARKSYTVDSLLAYCKALGIKVEVT